MIRSNSRKWRGTKEPLDKGENGDWKSWLKTQHSKYEDHGIRSHHFMANREKVQAVTDFIFLGSKITVDGDCSHELKEACSLEEKLWQTYLLFSCSVVSDSVTPWTTAHQTPLSFTVSRSLLKLMSIESMMPFNHLILCGPISFCPQSFSASLSFPMS